MTDIRKRWSARFSTRFGAIPYRYALVPFVWDTRVPSLPHWRFPDTTQGGIDLRPLPAQAIAGGAPQGLAFVAATQPVSGSEITRAMYVDEAATTVMRDAWQANMGYRPAGDQLRDMLWDQLTAGADPTGDAGPKPLMPTANGQLELWLGGHSLIKREPFRWGQHPHTNRVQAVLQRDFERMWEETNGDDHCRRVLDYHCRQYRVDDWQEFVPQRLRSHVPGRLPHATTYTDNFNRSNGPLGASWVTWQAGGSAFSISSNTCLANGEDRARYASSLSGSDNYSQANCTTVDIWIMSRLSTSATSDATWTSYALLLSSNIRTYKWVSGTATQISSTSYTSSAGTLAQSRSDGSTISTWYGGTQRLSNTDTAVSSGLAGGIGSTNTGVSLDNFETADLATGHPAMRRWGMSRGGIFRPVEIGREGVQVI